MGRRSKLKRFEVIKERHNVLEPMNVDFKPIKGRWQTDYFKNAHPITLELGCGNGEYTIGLARKFPDQNFIGVDIKGDRIWHGSGHAIEEKLNNVGFLRTEIQLLQDFFESGEVNEIWVTFPDPRPKDRDEKRRLTSPRFLEIYKSIIIKDGWVRFKTDNTPLFDYTLEVLQERKDIKNLSSTHDLYHSDLIVESHNIRTRFEQKFNAQGHDIKYLKFQFK